MDRNGAFTRYAHILKQTEQWLAGGYACNDNRDPIHLPPLKTQEKTATAHTDRKNKKHLSANTVGIIPEKRLSVFNPPLPVSPETGDSAQLEALARSIRTCENCNLHLFRENTVPGRGTVGAKLMIITSPPARGINEDASPLPLSESEYLNKWLLAMDLDPEKDVFITPAVKCRTPRGRPPLLEETAACATYLRKQYAALAPQAVLALGGTACAVLTGDVRDFPALVAKKWAWGDIPALVLWAPAEVLAHPNRLRRPVWEALKNFKATWHAPS